MPCGSLPDPKRSISAPKFFFTDASLCAPSMPHRTCSMVGMLKIGQLTESLTQSMRAPMPAPGVPAARPAAILLWLGAMPRPMVRIGDGVGRSISLNLFCFVAMVVFSFGDRARPEGPCDGGCRLRPRSSCAATYSTRCADNDGALTGGPQCPSLASTTLLGRLVRIAPPVVRALASAVRCAHALGQTLRSGRKHATRRRREDGRTLEPALDGLARCRLRTVG